MNDIITYTYRFAFPNKTEKTFIVSLDNETLLLFPSHRESNPDWTKLSFNQCADCPLDEKTSPQCPAAVNIMDLVDFCSDLRSYDEVNLTVDANERQYVLKTSLQRGISSLLGIYMVSSGCPIMEKLKPMVRYHVPLGTLEETRYRAISMYLMAQYFRWKKGEEPDWGLEKLVDLYSKITKVNKSFHKRLINSTHEDAGVNALVLLDCFAQFIPFSITKDMLGDIERLFDAY